MTLESFEKKISSLFKKRSRAIINLIDALCTDDGARSPVQLSLSPVFEGHYSNITKAIHHFKMDRKKHRKLLSEIVEKVSAKSFYLLAVDVTPYERKYAKKLEDKTIIHKPNIIKGKPITIGHDYSQVVCIPDHSTESTPWVIPLDIKRVKSTQKGHVVGMEQIKDLVSDDSLPFQGNLTVGLGDCAYSAKNALFVLKDELDKNLVFGARIKGDRKAYRAFVGKTSKKRPRWYGTELILNQAESHFPADLKLQYFEINSRKQEIKTEVSIWKNMLFKGSKDFNSLDFPCTLIQMVSYKKNGDPAFEKPLWVGFYGKLRDEIFPFDQVKLYRNRFKIEHFFKFIKQNLLMNDFQTPAVQHEESWSKIQQLAYLQLYAAKNIAQEYLYPWEKYLPKRLNQTNLPPKKVQQYFFKIYRSLPEQNEKPVPRGRNSGRKKGTVLEKRKNYEVIVKKKLAETQETEQPLPLEKLFDKKLDVEENLKNVSIAGKTVKSKVRKKHTISKPQGYYQTQLFPKQILGSLAMPQGQSP